MTETKRETLEDVLAAHMYDYPESFCDCGAWIDTRNPTPSAATHLAAEVRAWLARRAADDDVREAVTAALGVVRQRWMVIEVPREQADAAVAAFLGQVGT